MPKPRDTAIVCFLLLFPLLSLMFIGMYFTTLTVANFGGAGSCERYENWIFWNFWGNLASIIYSNTIFYICGILVKLIPADWHRVENRREQSKAGRTRNIIFFFAQIFLTPIWLFYSFISIWGVIIVRFTDSECSDTFQFVIISHLMALGLGFFVICCFSSTVCIVISRIAIDASQFE